MTAEPVQQPLADVYHQVSDDGWVEFTVGDALAYGWIRFWRNASVWTGLVVVAAAVTVVAEFVSNGFEFDGARGFAWSGSYSLAAVGGLFATTLVSLLVASVLTSAALEEAHGRRATLGGVVRLGQPVPVLLACALLAAGLTLGTLLLVIPALVFAFVAYYTLAFVLAHEQDAVSALRSSLSFVAANVGRFLMLALAVVAINLAGALLFGVGLLLTIPVTSIATMYAFRTLQGERVG